MNDGQGDEGDIRLGRGLTVCRIIHCRVRRGFQRIDDRQESRERRNKQGHGSEHECDLGEQLPRAAARWA